MDTGTGRLAEIDPEKAAEFEKLVREVIQHRRTTLKGSGIFHKNEIVHVKGSKFVITNITSHKLTLKILEYHQPEKKKEIDNVSIG
ncbi:MAG: hypothetical protein ACTSUP_07895 [Candidatus Heimdallarchaeaceae archaeon]